MARYTEVDSVKFEAFLTSLGFERAISNNEVVYVKCPVPNSNLLIKVYTSIRIDAAVARAKGEDAIRVVAIYDDGNKNFGIGKFARTYRTTSQESVHERVKSRIGEATKRCNDWLVWQGKAGVPGAPKGNFVGQVGHIYRMPLRVKARIRYAKDWLVLFDDKDGNRLVYWTERDTLEEGRDYEVEFEVKTHEVYNHTRQTKIVNCKGKRIGV